MALFNKRLISCTCAIQEDIIIPVADILDQKICKSEVGRAQRELLLQLGIQDVHPAFLHLRSKVKGQTEMKWDKGMSFQNSTITQR